MITLLESLNNGASQRRVGRTDRTAEGARKIERNSVHVEAYIEASRTPAPCPIKRDTLAITYAGALPTLRRLGADRVIRGFGLKW